MDDTSSPFYLHHGDHLGIILVTHPLTGFSNYNTWSKDMAMTLTAKYKIGFVDGSLQPLASLDDLLYTAWLHCNNMVCGWIINSVSREIGFPNLEGSARSF
ncbi:hypothetical protein PTKIN_Ptkin03bG0012100 [Pterospermum kingtungense]